ncbi:MAG: L,D-transpeptidase [Magnetococcales bacterium]|nr:L,D-transpeptidase [Magnetococcales bacterium]
MVNLRLRLLSVLCLSWLLYHPISVHGDGSSWQAYGDRVRLAESERLLLRGIEEIRHRRFQHALDILAQLVQQEPDFRLAHLIHGDLLQAQSGMLDQFGAIGETRQFRIQELNDLLTEAQVRANLLLDSPPNEGIPGEFLWLSTQQRHAIVIDLARSRLYLFRNDNNVPRLLADYYISSGRHGVDKVQQGDKKTPIGLYFITNYLPKKNLPELYGHGALPINYPNEWDRILHKTGDGIWLHGTPANTYSRPPKASDGCIVLTNSDFQNLAEIAGIGTPVIISRSLQWLNQQQWQDQRQSFLRLLQQWYRDWRSNDISRVLSYYSQDFNNSRFNYDSWGKRLQELLANNPDSGSQFVDLSVLGYPSEQTMVVVTFTQKNLGDERQPTTQRRQYWRMEAEQKWRIVYDDVG